MINGIYAQYNEETNKWSSNNRITHGEGKESFEEYEKERESIDKEFQKELRLEFINSYKTNSIGD